MEAAVHQCEVYRGGRCQSAPALARRRRRQPAAGVLSPPVLRLLRLLQPAPAPTPLLLLLLRCWPCCCRVCSWGALLARP